MCGIFGYVGERTINVKAAVDVITHRGPDGEGFHTYDCVNKTAFSAIEDLQLSNRRVYLGFRRLAIIDLESHSDQPFSREDLQLTIVFNGEIYNFLELREVLIENGYLFSTKSDTEVLLCAYHFWGEDCLNYFNGMWAFCIIDRNKNKIFCARDRFGVKPFYFCNIGNEFIFCSEIKQLFEVGIKREINEAVIRDYLENGLVDHTEETFYKNIYQLRGGHKIVRSLDKESDSINPERWYKGLDNLSKLASHNENVEEKFFEKFKNSIALRFRSDVPVGACLSGGLDSSAIVSLSAHLFEGKEIKTFNATFKEKQFDESHYADMVGEIYPNVNLKKVTLDYENIHEKITEVLYHQDEPFPTLSLLSQWEVMRKAKSENVVVLLDGQGGDEILAGYRKYYAFYLKELLQAKKFFRFSKEMMYLIINRDFSFFDKFGMARYLNIGNSNKALSQKTLGLKSDSKFGFRTIKDIKDCSRSDIFYYSYPALLRYEDRNSMAFSLEARVPFMDFELVEYMFSIPSRYKIKNGYTKWVLRETMKDILPEQIRKRISKLGFSTPQEVWLAEETSLRTYFLEYFKEMKNPYLNNDLIYSDFQKYPNGVLNSSEFSKYLIFDIWFKKNFS
jgi:asparagine synthase (glutamine-hydrolysing)